MMADHDHLLEEASSEVEDGQPSRGYGRRPMLAAIILSAAAAAVALALWAPDAHRGGKGFDKQAVSQLSGFGKMMAVNEETKEVRNNIPIYETGNGGHHLQEKAEADDVKDWEVYFSEEASLEETNAALADLPDSLKVIHRPDPDSGGCPFAILEGTLADLKDYIETGNFDGVDFIEEEGDVEIIHDEEEDAPERRLGAKSWGIDRLDERPNSLDQDYSPTNNGRGVHVYVLDTGVRTTHTAFEGRAIPTLEIVGAGTIECTATDTTCADDANGHGTHCAGTIGGKDYGVAQAATLHAVQVLADNGGGSFGWFNSAVDWIIRKGERPAVASASLGGKGEVHSTARVISRALGSGVIIVVAAGNEGQTSEPNACAYTPAMIPEAITVGSSTSRDDRSSFSNYGNCVDIFAPGSDIIAPRHDDDTATQYMSGTSMACPHVAGACALLLGAGVKPEDIDRELKSQASSNMIHDAKPNVGTPNKLLYVGGGAASTPAPAPPPAHHGSCASNGWKVSSGSCEVDEDCCLTSPKLPANYPKNEGCEITVGSDPGPIEVQQFSTEGGFDFLTVNGEKYAGNAGPHAVVPTGSIVWSSDHSVEDSGFKICLPAYGGAGGSCDESATGKGADYRGCQTKARSGDTCMKWTSQRPHTHTYTPEKSPGKGLGDHNFCRNPDDDERIWCYTTNTNDRWEYCDPLPDSVVEEVGGKKVKPAEDCVKNWRYGRVQISGFCTMKGHTSAWCSKDKKYDSNWADCVDA